MDKYILTIYLKGGGVVSVPVSRMTMLSAENKVTKLEWEDYDKELFALNYINVDEIAAITHKLVEDD